MTTKKEEETIKPREPWTGEPETLDGLLDVYLLESKFSARTLGCTMYLMQAKARDGTTTQCVDGQKFKLFIVPGPVHECN